MPNLTILKPWLKVASVFAAFGLWISVSATATAGKTGWSSGYLTFEKTEHVNDERGKAKLVTRIISGMAHAKDKGGPLDEAKIRCQMTFIVYTGRRGPAEGLMGYCVGIGSSGDTWEMLINGNELGGKWKFVDGVGLYHNIEGSGSWHHKGSRKDNPERYEWAGSWEYSK